MRVKRLNVDMFTHTLSYPQPISLQVLITPHGQEKYSYYPRQRFFETTESAYRSIQNLVKHLKMNLFCKNS